MTDVTEDVVQPAAAAAVDEPERRRQRRRLAYGAVGALLVLTAYLADRSSTNAELAGLDARADTMQQQALDSAAAARALAEQVRALGQQPVVTPPPGPTVPPVQPAAARGITGTSITSDGRLLVSYTDGRTEDKGVIVRTGQPGVGVAGTEIVDGALVLRYSDGRTEVVGRVVGRDGRGIVSISAASGRLVVTYTDATTTDLGPLPPGPAGADGRGIRSARTDSCRWLITYTTGETEDAGPACTTETVTAPRPTRPSSTSRAPTTTPER
ncbi:hypothetical protein [Allokutzneria albata]|uniref:Uncharacterized protein n=1 Tax=Allokutzneria albata TaxID=211114 RepID=A0A1H0DVR8_ALLAB|nr:hypothetical protein [Allokutzneria albata]SDN74071.1 hypothetical protein SAMN04489726_8013 [Allokutzneria albata]